jgi:uncharacterized membrane protein YgaE (UPF0421/DUF939 family)
MTPTPPSRRPWPIGRGPRLRRPPEELLDLAAERSRATAHDRVEDLRRNAWPILQVALAAALAWLVATEVIGHARPFFAPVSAIISLGVTLTYRGRRAVELTLGVALGIGIGDVLVWALGTGTLQIALVVILAMGGAVAVGGGGMLVTQAAVSGVLVATLQPPTHGPDFTRFVDALAGGTIGLLVSVLLPADPLATLRRTTRPVLEELAGVLGQLAGALRTRDLEIAERALERARAIDEDFVGLTEAVRFGRETARYAPARRHTRGPVARYADAAPHLDRAVRNVRVLARGVIRAVDLGEPIPEAIPTALDDLARAARALEGGLERGTDREIVRDASVRAARDVTDASGDAGGFSVGLLVGQVRSIAVDLLRAAGAERATALRLVRETTRRGDELALPEPIDSPPSV